MEVITLEAEQRETGKSASKRIRREDYVPCVLYGSEEEPRSFKLRDIDLQPLVYTDEFHRVSVQVDGDSFDCIVKDVTFHPVTDRIRHVDFQVLHEGQPIKLNIPVHFEGTAIGHKEGGLTQTFVNEVSIRCMPENLPNYFSVDITELEIGDSIMVRDLDRDGIEILTPSDQTLVTITIPRAIMELEAAEEEAAAAAAEELLEGEELPEGVEGEELPEGEEPVEGEEEDEEPAEQ